MSQWALWEVLHLLRFPVALCHRKCVATVVSYKSGNLRFFFKSEKFVRKQKAFNCFPPKGFCSQT